MEILHLGELRAVATLQWPMPLQFVLVAGCLGLMFEFEGAKQHRC